MRTLATIRTIRELKPIEKADKIEMAMMNNIEWQVVVKKGEHQVGQNICFIEIDSLVPEKPEFEFLRDSKFRIKTRKMRGCISQGIIFPLSILPEGTKIEEGLDVTEALQIRNYVKAIEDADDNAQISTKSKSKFLKFMMSFAWFRFIYLKLNAVNKGDWPDWGIAKSDEERGQICAKIFMNNLDKPWYICEKIDGQSFTFFTHKSKRWGLTHWIFGVCSRNIWKKSPDNSSYWQVTKKYNLKDKMLAMKEEVYCQAENINTNIQGNKYKVNEVDCYVFNVVRNGKRCSIDEMEAFSNKLGLKTVPILYRSFIPTMAFGNITDTSEMIQALVKMSIGQSKIADTPREGLVFRLVENPNVSFKIINPNFLLKYEQ